LLVSRGHAFIDMVFVRELPKATRLRLTYA
jgi:hypothetical protein